MALPASGDISLSQVNVELGLAAGAQISFNDAAVRTLFGVASGAISMSNGHGKSNAAAASVSFTANTLNAAVNVASLSGYVAGATTVTITVETGVYLWSDSSTPALTITGGTTGDTIKLINKGFIIGRGGNGDVNDASANPISAKTPGYDAISIGFPITIDNQLGYIGGGGGAGGSAQGYGGGGAGGGIGGKVNTMSGSLGGAVGQSGQNGAADSSNATAGGGGRVIPGTAKTGKTKATGTVGGVAGDGGSAGGTGSVWIIDIKGSRTLYGGGGGGGWGAAGGTGGYTNSSTNNGSVTSGAGSAANNAGGNWSTTGGYTTAGTYPGSAGGKAIRTNGNAVTWVGGTASSSRSYGAVG